MNKNKLELGAGLLMYALSSTDCATVPEKNSKPVEPMPYVEKIDLKAHREEMKRNLPDGVVKFENGITASTACFESPEHEKAEFCAKQKAEQQLKEAFCPEVDKHALADSQTVNSTDFQTENNGHGVCTTILSHDIKCVGLQEFIEEKSKEKTITAESLEKAASALFINCDKPNQTVEQDKEKMHQKAKEAYPHLSKEEQEFYDKIEKGIK